MKIILKQMLARHMDYKTDPEMEPFITNFFSIMKNIDFVLIKKLQASLVFNEKNIGTLMSPKYVLEREQNKYTLYVEHLERGGHDFFYELSRSLLIEIARLTNTNLSFYFNMIEPISKFFQISSLKDLAEEYEVEFSLSTINLGRMSFDEEDDKTSLIPCFGKNIPEEFMSRLDNSINKIFYPQKWVAYEVSEENFIWAMILYPVTDHAAKEGRYIIVDSADGEDEGKEVSVLDLYEILPKVISETEPYTCRDEQSLPLPAARNNDGVAEGNANNLAKVVEESHATEAVCIKRSIFTDLQEVSQLADETEKRKALKRLYLVYHPDKNSSSNRNIYENAFKYLKHQIDRLEQGKALEDPNNIDNDPSEPTVFQPSQASASYFNQWDCYVPRHSQNTSSRTQDDWHTNYERFYFDFTKYQPQPDPAEAERWLKQSYTDSKAMKILLAEEHQHSYERGNRESVICQIIFLAHEIIEKALKAGMYRLVGLDPGFLSNHQLLHYARSISSQRPRANALSSSDRVVSLITIASWINHFYLDSRFPNKHPQYLAPVDVHSREDAELAANYAQITFEFINSFVM